MGPINSHDLIQIGAYVIGMAVTIVAIKTDIRWIRKWCDDHQKADDSAFEQAREDIRELRGKVMHREGR